jgi:hypothetical protein
MTDDKVTVAVSPKPAGGHPQATKRIFAGLNFFAIPDDSHSRFIPVLALFYPGNAHRKNVTEKKTFTCTATAISSNRHRLPARPKKKCG